jgi:hypothetical protein
MKRNMRIAIAIGFMLCARSFGQGLNAPHELGFKAGAGSFSYIDDRSHARGLLGAEACAFCGGRYALFGTYTHYLAPGGGSSYKAADLFNVGLRIQGRRKVSPFFDVGFAAATSRFGAETGSMAGGGFGAGVAFRTERGLYIRPQFRLYVLSEAYIAPSAEIAVGWRF